MRAPEFWNAPPGLIAGLLAPAGFAWNAVGACRRALTRPYRATIPVVCVGNVVTGGAGKTPVVMALADLLRKRQIEAHVVTRGYGGRLAGPVRVDVALHDATEVGDEALLIADRAPCWVARDRAAGLRMAEAARAGLIILDDGFQNPTVAKDLSLLVVDGDYGFGNNRVMPAGPLREPVEAALGRADAVVLMGDHLRLEMLREFRGPILYAALMPVDAARWNGRAVIAFAGIGRPEKFFATLRSAGADIVAKHPFPDHHCFTGPEITALRDKAERTGAALVTTAKDWVRLQPTWRDGINVLDVELHWHDRTMIEELLAPIVSAACERRHLRADLG